MKHYTMAGGGPNPIKPTPERAKDSKNPTPKKK